MKRRAAATLGYSSAVWNASVQAHRNAAEKKFNDAQQRIVVEREQARMEKAAIMRQALAEQRTKEEAEAKAREREILLAQDADAHCTRRELEEELARRQLKEEARLTSQRRRKERKAREIAAEEHEEALFKAKLAARRAAADAEISRLDEQRSVRWPDGYNSFAKIDISLQQQHQRHLFYCRLWL